MVNSFRIVSEQVGQLCNMGVRGKCFTFVVSTSNNAHVSSMLAVCDRLMMRLGRSRVKRMPKTNVGSITRVMW